MTKSESKVLYARGEATNKTALAYKFRNDVLFKMLFVQNPGLLKHLVANILGIKLESIGEFVVKNPEMPPEVAGDKFCYLDISMRIDGRNVVLELQVEAEEGYKDRAVYYLAREYSSALKSGEDYTEVSQTYIISIVGFKLFECTEYYSEFLLLEKSRHECLTDNVSIRFFELPKLPAEISADDELMLWLSLFAANTEEELALINELEVPIMGQAIDAYHKVTATDEFKELERTRHYAEHNKATALNFARKEGYREAEEKWQGVIAEKDALIEKLQTQISKDGQQIKTD